MQLKGFLLIGLVLNVFCLNNLSSKFLSPKNDSIKMDLLFLQKNESFVASLKNDPSLFVELFAKGDPEKINHVIGQLEILAANSSSSLNMLSSQVTDATNDLNAATSNLEAADNNVRTTKDKVDSHKVLLEQSETDHSNAVTNQTNAVKDQQDAQDQKDAADRNYNEKSPTLINEQQVFQAVTGALQSLTAAKEDPEKINDVITQLEGLSADSSSSLNMLISQVTDATNDLNTANSNLEAANNNVQTAKDKVDSEKVLLEQAETDHSNAVIDQTNAVKDQQEAQVQKDVADRNYKELSPALINEQEIFKEVIGTLRSLIET